MFKLLNIVNLDLNITGNFIYSTHSLNSHLENIFFDHAKFSNFYDTSHIFWNFPEANLDTFGYVNNITTVNTDYESSRFPGYILFARDAGNFTANNIDCTNYYSSNEDFVAWVAMTMHQYWIPDDENQQTVIVSNVRHSMRWNERNNRIAISTFVYLLPHYRVLNMTSIGYTYTGINLDYSEFGFLGIWLFENDYFNSFDMQFINSTNPIYSIISLGYSNHKIINWSFSDISGAKGNSMRLELGPHSEFKNLQFINYKTQDINADSVIFLTSNEDSNIVFENVDLKNTWFYATPFIYLKTSPWSVVLNNFYYNQVHVAAGSALIVVNEIKDFEFRNHSFLETYPVDSIDNSAKFIQIRSFNVEVIETALLSNFSFMDSQLTFFSISSITGSPTEKKTLRVEDWKFTDLKLINSRSLITTNALVSEENFTIEFSNLLFSNVSYETQGNILDFSHQLSYPIVIKDSTFEEISLGQIGIETHSTNYK